MTVNRIDWDVLLAAKRQRELDVRDLLGRAFIADALRRALSGRDDPGTRLARAFCRWDERVHRECLRILVTGPRAPAHDVAVSLLEPPERPPWRSAEGPTWVRRLLADPRGRVRALGVRGLAHLRPLDAEEATAAELAALALPRWLDDPDPLVRAAAQEELAIAQAEIGACAACDAEEPIVAGAADSKELLLSLLWAGRPPVAFGTPLQSAAFELPGFRRDGNRLALGELTLRFGAEGLAEAVLEYATPLPLAESVLGGTLSVLAPRLTRPEIEARLRRGGFRAREDGDVLVTRGGARLHFGDGGRIERVTLRAADVPERLRPAPVTEKPVPRRPIDVLPDVELHPMDETPVRWLTSWDWDALAAEPGVLDAAGEPSHAVAVQRLIGQERLAQQAPGDLDAVLGESAIREILGWKAMERIIPVAQLARDGVDRRMAAVALGSSARTFAAEHGAELAALVDGFIEDADSGVALFGALKISRKLNHEGALSDECALQHVSRLERHPCQHVRQHATETRRMIEGEPSGLAAHFHPTSLEELAGQGIPPAGLWFPMTVDQAHELLGPPDRIEADTHSWKELALTFDDDGLRRVVVDVGNPFPVGSLLRDWRWFLWGTMSRPDVIAALDDDLETVVPRADEPGRGPQHVLEDGSIRTVGGAIIRFGDEESLATIEIDREAWAVAPSGVHWSVQLPDD